MAAAATPRPPGTAPPPPSLAEGHHFGRIKAVDTSARTLTFDLASLLTGERATSAAIEDGVIQPGESLDTDYYIRDESPRLRTLPYVEDVRIRLVNWPDCCDNRVDGDLAAFAAAFGPDGKTDLYRGPDSTYTITVEAGTVVRIREQYLP